MDRPMVSFNVHAHTPDVEFHPSVRNFSANGSEVISVDIVDMLTSVFLNRDRLHQLKDVLVAACEKYSILPVPPFTVTYGEEGRPAPYPCLHCGGTLFHLDTCSFAKNLEGRWVEA